MENRLMSALFMMLSGFFELKISRNEKGRGDYSVNESLRVRS